MYQRWRIDAMSHTVINLKEVEDQAPKFGLSPNVEMRMARVPLELEHSGVSYQRIAPNFRLPFGHKHKTQEEVYIVLSGSLRAKIEDEVVELKPLDAVGVLGVNHIAFRTPDAERLRRFYLELLGGEAVEATHTPVRVGSTLLVFL